MTDSHKPMPDDQALINIIKKSKIFSQIDEEACKALLPRFEKIHISQEETLFEQGQPSDSLYILVEGHLMAILNTAKGKQKIIGAIERGETVGELGALSNQPRSLSVKATTNCLLLKLTRSQFESFAKEHPAVMFYIIDLIISRSQNIIRLFSKKKLYKHIAVIQGNDQAPIEKFMSMLNENIAAHDNVILIEDTPEELDLSEVIDEAERYGKIVIFNLKPENLPSLEDRLNHIGEIFVVIQGDHPSKFSEFALTMLGSYRMPTIAQPELVLLHNDNVVMPKNTIYWLKQAKFTLHHHIRVNQHADYQRLLRIMTGTAIGLVLGGGGSKGWVSIGSLKAILEAKVPIDIIGGTSVGALVGAAYAMTLSYDQTYEILRSLTEVANNPFMPQNFTWPLISLLSSEKPTSKLQELFGEIQIEDFWLPFFAVSSNLTSGKEAIHLSGSAWQNLRATMALPGIVPPMVMDGQMHVDGGLLNNLPVDHMRTLIGNESTVIAVSLSDFVENKQRYNFPPILPFRVGLLKRLRLGYKQYTFPPYFYTFLNALLLGSSSKEKANRMMADIVVCPNLNKYRALQISTKRIRSLVDIGYKSTQEELASWNFFPLNENPP
jgi:NTE family protein